MTHTLLWILALTACGITGAFVEMGIERFFKRRRTTVVTRTAELDKVARRVARIPSPDLGSYLEMATSANYDAVRSKARAVTDLQRLAAHEEALAAVRLQEALLEEQKVRGLV